jgi:hypothetical protein
LNDNTQTDSSDDETEHAFVKTPKITFVLADTAQHQHQQQQRFSLWRQALPVDSNAIVLSNTEERVAAYVSALRNINANTRWSFLMCSGASPHHTHNSLYQNRFECTE